MKNYAPNGHTLSFEQAADDAILPGGHRDCIGEICTPHPDGPLPKLVVAMIEEFLFSGVVKK